MRAHGAVNLSSNASQGRVLNAGSDHRHVHFVLAIRIWGVDNDRDGVHIRCGVDGAHDLADFMDAQAFSPNVHEHGSRTCDGPVTERSVPGMLVAWTRQKCRGFRRAAPGWQGATTENTVCI